MKQNWLEKYQHVSEKTRGSADVLTGFNANIDVIHSLEDLDLDLNNVRARHVEKVENVQELKQELKHCFENGINEEVELKTGIDLGEGVEKVGGQAGIMSNFLSNQNNAVVFYTSFLSEELAGKMNENILSPVMDGKFVLKNVRDTVTADRTKRNIIIEYENNGDTGRTIFSRKMKGFGPYFRKGIEDNFQQLEENTDRAVFSGFHDVEGNMSAKLKKAEKQLGKLSTPIHLEYVHRDETAELILEHVVPQVQSIGLDEDEALRLAELIEVEVSEDLSLGDAFQISSDLIDMGLKRVHIHTYRYHLTVTRGDYEVAPEKVRDAMLYGELSAIIAAEKGGLPEPADYPDFTMENKHLHRLDDLEHFEDFFELESFVETGIAELHGLNVVAIPTIIHEDPARLVGLGDVISSGAFIGEIN